MSEIPSVEIKLVNSLLYTAAGLFEGGRLSESCCVDVFDGAGKVEKCYCFIRLCTGILPQHSALSAPWGRHVTGLTWIRKGDWDLTQQRQRKLFSPNSLLSLCRTNTGHTDACIEFSWFILIPELCNFGVEICSHPALCISSINCVFIQLWQVSEPPSLCNSSLQHSFKSLRFFVFVSSFSSVICKTIEYRIGKWPVRVTESTEDTCVLCSISVS